MILTHGANSLSRGGGGNFVEIGGRRYPTVELPDGTIWLGTSLDWKFCTYVKTSYSSRTDPLCKYYNQSEETYSLDGELKCGLLYNWPAVKYLEDNKSTLIPGWHVPSKTELINLRTAIGGSYNGNSLKAVDGSVAANWPANWNGNDLYGMQILPSGKVISSSSDVGTQFYMWSATSLDTNYASSFRLDAAGEIIDGDYFYTRDNMFSIRLVKDAT